MLKGNEERILITAQDQGLRTNWFRRNIEGADVSEKCRLCGDKIETVNTILAGCEVLLKRGTYTDRHNRICKLIHFRLCQKYNISIEANNHWVHTPAAIEENNEVLLLYDYRIPTDLHIAECRPDIVIHNKLERKALVIEVGVPGDTRVTAYEREKIIKYQALKHEIRRMWEVDSVEVIPIVLGATGTVKRSVVPYLEKIPVKLTTSEMCLEVVRASIGILKIVLGI